MTGFEITEFPFTSPEVERLVQRNDRFSNWPVVYLLHNSAEIYVGESLNGVARLRQHLKTEKRRLEVTRVVMDPSFNKSVCLDLESYLIRLLAGDGKYQVLNRNEGITNADYYDRDNYQTVFDEIFTQLRDRGAFTRSVRDIQNTDLFKLSPFKALTQDQAVAVEDILEGLFADLDADLPSRIVIQGGPGTGKTVVAIFLAKLLSDIRSTPPQEASDSDSLLSEFFVEGYGEKLVDFKFGLVVPQQSLRRSIKNVFAKTPGLRADMVMTPFEVGEAAGDFDLLIVDEAHRLNQRSNQPSGPQNAKFKTINERLFGADDVAYTQLDWINVKSKHQIYLVDAAQSVRPHDVTQQDLDRLTREAEVRARRYPLASQMRVQAGDDYVGYIRAVIGGHPPRPARFVGYDLRMFDDLDAMVREVRAKDDDLGLARLVAGYAWSWKSKGGGTDFDIVIGDVKLRWNSQPVDWVNSPGSVLEVGSIHTIQGYDLNYAGVIIGRDLRLDPTTNRIVFDRSNYHDKKGMENNRARGIVYDDVDLLRMVVNIYAVLLTRGIRGTFVYVCDEPLREYLRTYFEIAGSS